MTTIKIYRKTKVTPGNGIAFYDDQHRPIKTKSLTDKEFNRLVKMIHTFN